MKNKVGFTQIAPVMAGFFVMGFIDVVGIASNYIKKDFQLSDTVSNLMLMMVYLWFFLLSVPVGVLMDKAGRKNTVLISLLFTCLALVVPVISYNLPAVLLTFSLIGIGNTIIQVSANSLLADIVTENKVASNLTFGQFIKSVSSFLGPVLAGFAALHFNNWKLIFPAFALVTILTGLWLYFTRIEESGTQANKTSIKSCLSLLNDRFILGLFLGIVLVVGIDVGLNTTLPKFLIQKANIPLEKAGLGTSLYFAAKTAGNFIGAFLLIKIPARKFYTVTTSLAILALGITILLNGLTGILIGIFAIGLAVSNIFAVIFSLALTKIPERKNELSGLMMMGIIGGAIIPLLMGMVSDNWGQVGALAVLLLCLVYLLFNSVMKKESRVQTK